MNIETTSGPIHVLMVEDNPDDVFLTKEAFADAEMKIDLDVVNDGWKPWHIYAMNNLYFGVLTGSGSSRSESSEKTRKRGT